MVTAFAAGYLARGLSSDEATPDRGPREYRAPVTTPLPEPISTPDAESPPEFADLLSQADVFATLHLAFELAADADLEKLESLASEALRYDDPLFSFNIADIFVERMTAIDVNAALDFAESLPAGRSRSVLITSIYRSWLRRDADAANAYADSVTDPLLQQMLLAAAEPDAPGAVFGRQTSLGVEIYGSGAISYTARANPARQRELRQQMRELRQGMRDDPEGTIEGLLADAEADEQRQLLPSAIALLAQQDPQLALDYLTRFPDELRELEGVVLSAAASQDPDSVSQLAEDYARRTGNVGPMSTTLSALMKTDVELALARFDTVPEQFKSEVALAVGAQYAQQDPQAALSWMLEQPMEDHYLQVAVQMGGPEVQAAAESLLYETTDDEARQQLLQAVANNRTQQDPAGTVAWLEQFDREPGFANAYQSALSQWAGQDPAAAAAHLESNPQYDSAASSSLIAYYWITRDPDAAIAWAQGLDSQESQESATGAMVSALTRTDPARARDLYDSLPDGPAKFRAGAQMAMQQARFNKTEASQIMEEMGIPPEYVDNYMNIMQP